MTALKIALLALALQAAPQQPKATVSGVVVNGNGEPIPNIRVTLGKLGVNLGPFTQFVLGDHPSRETTISAEAFAAIGEEIQAEVDSGGVPPEELRQIEAFKSVPIQDIQEITVTPSGSMSVVYKSAPPVMTDEQGRFSISVDPGSYRLTFSGVGYAKQSYGQRTASGSGVPLTLAPGQAMTNVAMRMLPVSSVSGRIRDNSGQPAAGVPVRLFRYVYDETGKRTTQSVTSAATNDLGEYRMYYLTPGRYYVSAGSTGGGNTPDNYIFNSSGGYSSSNRIPQRYSMVYYPGVSRENDATSVEVPAGSELRGVDLVVAPQQTYKVRGRVLDARTGQPPPQVSLSLVIQNLDPNSGFFSSGVGNTNYKPNDGTFELQNVSAGAYVLTASIPRPNNGPINFDNMSPAERNAYFQAQQADDLLRPKASLPLNVNSDLDGLVVMMGLNGTISGHIRAEGNATPSLDFVRIQFKNNVPTSFLEGGPNSKPVASDGAFRVENVRPGDYRVTIAGIPDGFYLKGVRAGDTDVLNEPLRYGGGETTGLEIVLSPNVGAVEGETDAGAQVVLIPSRNRERTELFHPVIADSAGHFAIPNVAPGDYTLAAWEAIEPYSFFDSSLIGQAETQGKAVHVAESSRQQLNVTAIR